MYQANTQTFQDFQDYFHIQKTPWEYEKKLWKKVEKYIPPLRVIPGIVFVGVGNSLSMNACHKESDIDLFIITKKNRLWMVRILVTLYFSLLGQRKTSRKHAGKFCLSFFVTEDALDFWGFAIENDIYLYFWILHLKPLIDKGNTYNNFLQANSSWADFSLYQNMLEENTKYIFSSSEKVSKNTKIWNWIEKVLKKIFLPKTKKSSEKLGDPFGIIISDDILKFHDRDKRKEIRDKLL